MAQNAGAITKDDLPPGSLVILRPSTLDGSINSCRNDVHRYLHEADKVMRLASASGGTSMLMANTDGPVLRAAKLAKREIA